jgi:hypothetical protein
MFSNNILLPTKIVKEAANMTDNQMIHLRQLAESDQNVAAVLPGKPETTGKPRLFDPLRAALACIMADFIRADVKAPLAAKIARRIMEGHQQHPAVEQWAIVVTMNGNVSTLPYGQADLSRGAISGSRLAFALMVDLKNYAERVAAAIADAPKVIGGSDEE